MRSTSITNNDGVIIINSMHSTINSTIITINYIGVNIIITNNTYSIIININNIGVININSKCSNIGVTIFTIISSTNVGVNIITTIYGDISAYSTIYTKISV